MNVVKHRFASAKADGADASQVQPSHWNDGHLFQGGNHGEALIRDTADLTFGAKWGPFPAVGGVFVDQPFNAADFAAVGGGAWNATQQMSNTWARINEVGVWLFGMDQASSALTGAPYGVTVKFPTGLVPGRPGSAAFNYATNGVGGVGWATWAAGSPVVTIYRDPVGTPYQPGALFLGGVFLIAVA